MLPDASAVTAACEKRRKFALREIKNNAGKGYAAGWINLCASGAKRAYMPCKFDYSRLSRRLLKFEAYKIWPSLSAFRSARLCKFDGCGFAPLAKSALNLKFANLCSFYFSPAMRAEMVKFASLKQSCRNEAKFA